MDYEQIKYETRDGILTITQANTFAAGGETVAFFQHLKAAGFITGNAADAAVAALPLPGLNRATVLLAVAGSRPSLIAVLMFFQKCLLGPRSVA
mgnify:CR=1 FL=1